tara:strand:- start:4990 stop:5265 length:276 start_codon:yes stop_codon:yes gene_type:complete
MNYPHIIKLSKKELIEVLIMACRELNIALARGYDIDPEDGRWDANSMIALYFDQIRCTIEMDDGREVGDVERAWLEEKYNKALGIKPAGGE